MSDRLSDEQGEPSFGAADVINEMAAAADERKRLPEVINGTEIRAVPPQVGGTEIIVQRHGKYIREGENVGSLTPESGLEEEDRGATFLRNLLNQLPPDQRESVDILIVASDTSYYGGGRRSFETAEAIQRGMTTALAEAGLGMEHILNNTNPVETPEKTMATGGPLAIPSLREPRMFDDRRYGVMLSSLYPNMRDKMIAFEEDGHAETRKAIGGEAPDEIAARTLATVDLLSQLATEHHTRHPGRRLVIWADTHYDTISPLVKLTLAGGNKTDILGVDYGGGITIDIPPGGHATSTIGETTYEVPLTSRG